MITKNNKKLIISGILLIISTVCYALYQILFSSFVMVYYGIEGFPIAWGNVIFRSICAIILALYCFLFHKAKVGKMIYLFGIASFTLWSTNSILSGAGNFDFYAISDILFLAITVFMIIAKIKTNKGICIIGTILFIIYALTQIFAIVSETLNSIYIDGIVWSAYYIYLIVGFIAFFNLWLVEGGNLAFAKRQNALSKALPKDDLALLKQLLDNGTISVEEYNRKKREILNKL